MKHADWLALVKPALRLPRARRGKAVEQLVAVARRSHRAARNNVGAWHEEQCLGIAAAYLAELGRHSEAAALYRRLARKQRSRAVYYLRAVVDNLRFAAESLRKVGSVRASETLHAQAAAVAACFASVGVPTDGRGSGSKGV